MMVTPIGSMGGGRPVDQLRTEAPRTSATAGAAAVSTPEIESAPANPAAAMAAQGAPVDTTRVAAIKAAIASGSYKADPQAIADRMIAQDLPAQG